MTLMMAVMKTTLQRSQVGQKLFLNEMLQRLRPKKQPRGIREKVKVDQGDLVMDVYSFFKSPDFDPKIPILMSFKGSASYTGHLIKWNKKKL